MTAIFGEKFQHEVPASKNHCQVRWLEEEEEREERERIGSMSVRRRWDKEWKGSKEEKEDGQRRETMIKERIKRRKSKSKTLDK